MAANWKVDGKYMEVCNCEVTCPCNFLSPPTEGNCTDVVAWHIERGNFGPVALDNLNVVMALHSPGKMTDGNWKAALYLDDRASTEQQEALTKIFGGQAGGHPAALASFVAEVRGVGTLPLTLETDGKKGRLRIGTIGEAEAEALESAGGEVTTISNTPLSTTPGFPVVVARSKYARFSDHDITLDVAGRNALLSPFSYFGSTT